VQLDKKNPTGHCPRTVPVHGADECTVEQTSIVKFADETESLRTKEIKADLSKNMRDAQIEH
jgi:hypothetical protein